MANDPKSQTRLTPVELRKRRGLTQRKVAAAVDIREQTISEWERGLTIPHLTPSQYKALLDIYECTPEELVSAFEPDKTTN